MRLIINYGKCRNPLCMFCESLAGCRRAWIVAVDMSHRSARFVKKTTDVVKSWDDVMQDRQLIWTEPSWDTRRATVDICWTSITAFCPCNRSTPINRAARRRRRRHKTLCYCREGAVHLGVQERVRVWSESGQNPAQLVTDFRRKQFEKVK